MRSDLRILWHSVSSYVKSGYGIVTKNVTSRLKQAGFDIMVSAYYGIEPGGIVNLGGVIHLPCIKDNQFGRTSCVQHYKAFNRNLAILHTDYWAFPWFPSELDNTMLYGPLDQIELGEELQAIFRGFTYVVSLCPFMQKELRKYGVESVVIPHGVDTSVYYPIPKKEARATTGMGEDLFIFGMVSANSDKEPRKAFPQVFRALRLFLDNNPDVRNVRLYLHTNPDDPRGIPLKAFAHKFKLDNIVAFEPYYISTTGLSDSDMNVLYNSFDVLLNPSFREGFGLPILESMATGTPVIAHDFSSMPDLVAGRGWLCKTKAYLDTPINAVTGIPDVESLAECIADAYFHPDKVEKYGRLSLEFARQHDWDKLVKELWIPYLDKISEEIKPKPLEERKLI